MRISDCSSDVCSSDLFVLFHQAQGALLIATSAASLFSAIVTISMATTPFLLLLAQKLEFARPSREKEFDGPDQAPHGAAIVIGYGRFGQTVAQMLMGNGCAGTIIDKKPDQIELARKSTRLNYRH